MKTLVSALVGALAVLVSAPAGAQDRGASPMFVDEGVAEFRQDVSHPRGVWRWTTLDSYRSDHPRWETLLDIDQLARDEGRDWTWRGADCRDTFQYSCLIRLSEGGGDAVTVREFVTDERVFADPEEYGGFALPPGRHRTAWEDDDTLLVATDFGPDAAGAPTVTGSGYPFTVRRWKRDETLADAVEVFRGDRADRGEGVRPVVDRDGRAFVLRQTDAGRGEVWTLADNEPPHRLILPERLKLHGDMVGPSVSWMLEDSSIDGYAMLLVFTAEEPWTFQGRTYSAGTLLAPLSASLQEGQAAFRLASYPDLLVFTPGPGQSLGDVDVSTGRIIAVLKDRGGDSLNVFHRNEGRWERFVIPTPVGADIRLGDSDPSNERIFYTYERSGEPRTLMLANLELVDWVIEGSEGSPPLGSAASLTEKIGPVTGPENSTHGE